MPRRSSSVRQPSTSAETTSRFHIVDKMTTGLVKPDRFSVSIDLRPCDGGHTQRKRRRLLSDSGAQAALWGRACVASKARRKRRSPGTPAGGAARRTAIFSSKEVLVLWAAMSLLGGRLAEWGGPGVCWLQLSRQSLRKPAVSLSSRRGGLSICSPQLYHPGPGRTSGAMDSSVEKAAAEVLDDNLVLL